MVIIEILFVAFCAWLHRWRGGGWPRIDLPGGPAVAPSLVLGLVVFPVVGWQVALLYGLGYLVANVMGHGAYIDMGTQPATPEKEVSWIDKIARKLGYGLKGDVVGLALYQLFALPLFIGAVFIAHTPILMALACWLMFGVMSIGAYYVFVRVLKKVVLFDRNALAEYATGLAWGLALVGISP